MALLSTAAGVVLVVVALNDVFHTLLRPSATGRLTSLVSRTVWATTNGHRRLAVVSGPLTILATIAVWLTLVALGWALIYLPHVPEGFSYSGIDPSEYSPFAEAVSFSLVALTTLGLGDVAPVNGLLRVIVPLEALTGFALLSASVSWFMQLYPALARLRSFAIRLTTLHDAGITGDLGQLSRESAASIVRSVAHSLADLTADLVQNSEIFFFTEEDPRLSPAQGLRFTLELRDSALASEDAGVRAQGRELARIIDELARVLGQQYPRLAGDSTDSVIGRAAERHGHPFGDPAGR